MIWAATGLIIAARIFGLEIWQSAMVAAFLSLVIYLVERLMIAIPKGILVTTARIFIGAVIALLGASAVDMTVFEREIADQLKADGEVRITSEFDALIDSQRQTISVKKSDWLNAQGAANCEANGTCGSRVRSVGPVYKELSRHANLLREEFVASQVKLDQLMSQKANSLQDWRNSSTALEQAGLLARIQALHTYTMNHPAAMVGWIVFFLLMLSMELMVVLSKMVFPETVDDHIETIREQISKEKAHAYLVAMTSPEWSVRQLINSN
jgi:hypothetical protein